MRSILLEISARFMLPLMLVLSLIVLYRGHNLPGGGFIGGLLAASAFILLALAEGVTSALRTLRLEPISIMSVGLLIAALSTLFAPLAGKPFMTGLWLPAFELPILGAVHLGTPLIFDIGVYLTVLGFVLKTAFALEEVD